MNLGDRILAGRQNMKITQEELALKLGVTSQAVSKWERNQSFPDIFTFAQLCRVLNVSADLLLETECGNFSESNDMAVSAVIKKKLRQCEEPLMLEFGVELADAVQKNFNVKRVEEQREILADKGILMPILHIRDNASLEPKEFTIKSYHKVLYHEQLETVDASAFQYMVEKTGLVVKERYDFILNKELVRKIVEALKIEYPAVVEHVVPDIISYGLLKNVMVGLLQRGCELCHMIKILEVLEEELRRKPDSEIDELVCAAAKEIEREQG